MKLKCDKSSLQIKVKGYSVLDKTTEAENAKTKQQTYYRLRFYSQNISKDKNTLNVYNVEKCMHKCALSRKICSDSPY